MSIEDRLKELEIRYAYQSEALAALDEVVREFAARVERLERQQAALGDAGAAPGPPAAPDEPPPHY